MKRSLPGVVGLLLLAVSCGGGDGGSDMMSSLDLAPPDLIPSLDLYGTTGCKGLVACINACSPFDNVCQTKCFNNTAPAGLMLYDAAGQCIKSYCVGVGRCIWANPEMTLVSSKGADPPAVCGDCVHDASTPLFGDACTHPGTADCTQTQCAQSTSACLNDLP